MAKALLGLRKYLVVLRTKTDDIEYPVQAVSGRAGILNNLRLERVELQPAYEKQAEEIFQAYELIYKQGGWTVYNDEEWYLEEELGLTKSINKLLTQGRAKKVAGRVRPITVVMGAQRPSRISRFVLSQSMHVITFGVEGRDALVVGEATSKKLVPVFEQLSYADHEFAWYHRPTRSLWTGRLQDLGGEA